MCDGMLARRRDLVTAVPSKTGWWACTLQKVDPAARDLFFADHKLCSMVVASHTVHAASTARL